MTATPSRTVAVTAMLGVLFGLFAWLAAPPPHPKCPDGSVEMTRRAGDFVKDYVCVKVAR